MSWKPKWETRKETFIASIVKMCPRCGTLNDFDAGGCINCLHQFNKGVKNVRQQDSKSKRNNRRVHVPD